MTFKNLIGGALVAMFLVFGVGAAMHAQVGKGVIDANTANQVNLIVIPEPGSIVLLLGGVVVLLGFRCFRTPPERKPARVSATLQPKKLLRLGIQARPLP